MEPRREHAKKYFFTIMYKQIVNLFKQITICLNKLPICLNKLTINSNKLPSWDTNVCFPTCDILGYHIMKSTKIVK